MAEIKYADSYNRTHRGPVAEVVKGFLLDTYADGAMERVADQVDNVAEMLGIVIERLHARDLLSDADLEKMMLGHTVVR